MEKTLGRIVFLAATLLSGFAMADPAPSGMPLEVAGPMGPLEGTLLEPPTGSVATVLIVPGSGPTDRDGNSPLGIKASTYRLLAQGLASQGVATLRIDKRGMFGSAAAVKDANAVTISDYVADVRSWVAALRNKTGAPCVWVLGHSEGGLVAMASAHDLPSREICGLVLVSSPGRPMGDILRAQLKSNPANALILPQALPAIDALEKGHRVDVQGMHPALQRLFNPSVQGFLIDAFAYDPRRMVAGLTIPVLILQGQRDLQVSEQDARLLQQADPKAKLVILADVNHVLKPIDSADRQANIATYSDAQLPLAQGVVQSIADFVVRGSSAGGN